MINKNKLICHDNIIDIIKGENKMKKVNLEGIKSLKKFTEDYNLPFEEILNTIITKDTTLKELENTVFVKFNDDDTIVISENNVFKLEYEYNKFISDVKEIRIKELTENMFDFVVESHENEDGYECLFERIVSELMNDDSRKIYDICHNISKEEIDEEFNEEEFEEEESKKDNLLEKFLQEIMENDNCVYLGEVDFGNENQDNEEENDYSDTLSDFLKNILK